MVYSACTPRQRGQALPSHERLLRMPDIGLDGVAIASHPPPHALTHHGDTGPDDPPRRVRRAWLRSLGFCMGWCRLTLAGSLCRAPAWSPHEAAAEEIQTRAAKHLALQHFQAVDVPLDRAGRPRQGDAGFDRCIVLAEPARKALDGLQCPGGGAREPGIKALRLPLADEGRKVLREGNRLGDLGRLRVELGELLGLGRRAGRGASQDQPRRPARRQGLGDRLRHHRQALAPALAAGGDALGLAEAADRGRDAAIASRLAPRLECAKQLDGGMAARIPTLKEQRFVGMQAAPSVVASVLPPGPRRHLPIPLDGASAAAPLRGDGRGAPALAVQGPCLIVARLPAGGALGRAGFLGRGRGRRGPRDGDRAIRQGHGLLAPGGIDGLQGAVMRGEDGLQGFRQVLDEVEAGRDLGGRRRAVACPLSIRARPIPGDHLHPGMLPQPLGHGVGRAIGEEIHGLAALQINEHRAIRVAFPQGEIVHPPHPGRGEDRPRQPAQPTQPGVTAHGEVPRAAELHPGPAPERQTQGNQALGEPQGAPGPGGRDGGQPFGADPARTGAMAAKPLADAQLEAHAIRRPGQVGQRPCIVAVDTPCREGAERTGHAGRRRAHLQGDLRRGVIDMTCFKAPRSRIR